MNRRGQALIETAAFFLAISVLLGAFCGFTRWFAVRQKLLLAAKLGALLYSSGRWTKGEVEGHMRDYLATGSPGLQPNGIHVSVGPRSGEESWTLELDQSTARYTPPGGWHYLLGASSTISEQFIVKHAPRYWAPMQPWGGPAVSYGS